MDALELLYDYFEDRAHATAIIRQRRPFALGLLGALIGASALYFAQALSGRLVLLSFSWPSMLLSLLWRTSLLFAAAATLHFLLDLSGARGDVGALFVHLGLSELAWMAAVPCILIAQSLPLNSPWPVRLTFVAVGFWSLALKARALRDEYGVGQARAWVTLLFPGLALACFAALSTTLAVAAFVLKAFSA
ncbi:MAG: hypothetical protein A2506_01360 [Elusimicrobia bacterium RIFOXYD12_FULL_66_9]|nr:MAG: hypothetical protein A2506_01360 [Elusimicrobia bacterium RIFOXYD12_FULL_66_9]